MAVTGTAMTGHSGELILSVSFQSGSYFFSFSASSGWWVAKFRRAK